MSSISPRERASSDTAARPTASAFTSTVTAAFTLRFSQIGRGDLAVAGGKGANLGELVRAGFRVPDGFVITTTAYDHLVAHAGLADTIAPILREPEPSGEALRSIFEGAAIPVDLTRAILAAYQALGRGPVAVRSSATAEDLPDAAFAGQQDTFLNIVGEDALLSAVRRCWASLWTDRAIVYRARKGFDQRAIKLAVVVQRMALAEVAGVLFTANPVTGARDEIAIDASPGLGEAVVSGLVTPDHFVLRRGRLGHRIVERRLGLREVFVRPRAGGGVDHISAAARGSEPPRPALPDATLRALARLGAAVERRFGAPQDIEWAFASGEIWLLQARPITALPAEAPDRPTQPSQKEQFASIFADMLSTRPYPMDLTAWGPGIYGAVLRTFKHFGIKAVPFEELFIEEDSVIIKLRDDATYRPTRRALLAPAYLAWYCARYNPLRWREIPTIAEGQARVRFLESRDLKALSWSELIATVREATHLPNPLLGEPRRRYSPRAMMAAGILQGALKLVQHEDRLDALQSGLETHTLAANRALEALASQVRGAPALADAFARHEGGALREALLTSDAGRGFLHGFDDFIERYGHREAVMFAVLEPTWKDAPEVVLAVVKGLAAAPPRVEPARPAWEAARDELLQLPALKPAPLRAAFLRVLAEARCMTEIREDTHFYGTMPMPVLRRALLEMGRRLAGEGALDAPEDIFHLRLDEVERAGAPWPPPPALVSQLRATMERRRARRAALADTPVVDLLAFPRAKVQGDALASGTPGSPGAAEGPARVIRDASEFGKLRPGDVLVAPFTNPAWTPLFQRAAAVVVDSGGAASHAAIVAREYGIPAVMGTGDGTRRIRDGAEIRVDGTRGVVVAAASSAEARAEVA